MMFDDEDPTQTTSQELYGKVSVFLQKALHRSPDQASEWWKSPIASVTRNGPIPSLTANNVGLTFDSKRDAAWQEIQSALDDVISCTTNDFKPQLENWVSEVYPTLQLSEREEKSEDIQWAITSVLGFGLGLGAVLGPYFKAKDWSFTDDGKAHVPKLLEKLASFKPIILELVHIFCRTGYICQHWFRWFFIRNYFAFNQRSTFGSIPHNPTHPKDLLACPYNKYVFETLANNPAALFLAMKDGAFGLFSSILTTDMKYLANYPEELNELRPFQLANLEAIMTVADHFVALCTGVHSASYLAIVGLFSQIAWTTGFLACNAIKAKEMDYPYDHFASRIAEYCLWCGQFARNGGYTTAFTNIMVNNFKEFDVFNRQICLSKKSIQYMTPVYEYIKENCMTDENQRVECNMLEPKALKPKLPDLIAVPTLDQLNKWSPSTSGLASALDGCKDHYKYWEPKCAQALELVENNGDLSVLIDEWQNRPQVQTPMELFAHDNKKSVDFDKVFGKVQYVTGGSYDFRVKIVNAGSADVDVKIVKSQPAHGEWAIVNASPDFKVKLVKAGTYDFTVKLK